jgi:hypothetical protein
VIFGKTNNRARRAALGAALLFLPAAAGFLGAQETAARGERLTVKIALMGPGTELYFWWGHVGLIIEDASTGRARFYDWGVFSFQTEHFFRNFAFGRLNYMCAASPEDANFYAYLSTNRSITVYTLDLPPEAKERVRQFAEWNIRPENREYNYHHFKDNCSTRVRDILDLATDGQFSAAYGGAPGRFTLREHVRRHTWAHPFEDWILNFWMGQNIDRPITVWDEMFLPSELALRANEFTLVWPDGSERPLVYAEEVVNTALGRPPVLDEPPRNWPQALALGLALAALCTGAVILERKKGRPGRLLLGLSEALLGLMLGAAGSILFFMMAFTNHDYTYANANIIFVNPLLFVAVPFGIILAFSKSRQRRQRAWLGSQILWTYVTLAGVLTMVMKLFPQFWQQNQVTQALVLPWAFALSLGMAKILVVLLKRKK